MNRRSSTPPREWRKAGSNASRIDLSGYASSQHRRFLKAEAEQSAREPRHHYNALASRGVKPHSAVAAVIHAASDQALR